MSVSKLRLACAVTPAIALFCACGATGGGGGSSTGAGSSGAAGGATSSSAGSGGSGSTADNGVGVGVGVGGSSGTGSGTGGGESCGGELPVIIRDFSLSHPDFEKELGDDENIVATDLGPDGKPVYAGGQGTLTTHGKAAFDQWYRDVPGVNQNIPITLKLTQGANGVYTYDNQAFFPIDNQGFGSQGFDHNFHFTDEVHTQFTYKGGEVFTFTGDDDLFAYVNKKLVINLGGVHGAETATVKLDEVAGQLGLTKGQKYPLDLFGAERHTSESHYRIETTIDCFTPPPPPK